MRSFAIKVVFLVLIASLLASCSRLTYIPVHEPLPPFSPPDMSAFQPGDIVLTFSTEPISWLMSLMASSDPDQLKKPYNHGEVVFIGDDGQKRLGGFSGRVMSKPLEDRIPMFYKVAVLRAKNLSFGNKTLAKKMAKISNNPHYQNANFDYSFRDVPGRTNKFYCLGLINEVHRQANAPIPFPHKPIKRNAILAHIEELLHSEIKDGPIVEDLFSNPNYELVLEWTNNQHKYMDTWFSEHITRYTLDIYEQGWRLKKSDGPLINLFLWLFDDSDESLDPVKKTLLSFQEFHTEVGIDWEKLSTAGKLDGLTEEEKLEILRAISNKYRNEYFIKETTITLVRNEAQ